MFQACTLVMRRDAQTAMFLLPYIVQVLSPVKTFEPCLSCSHAACWPSCL